jgi:hypothetical protein
MHSMMSAMTGYGYPNFVGVPISSGIPILWVSRFRLPITPVGAGGAPKTD